MTDILENIPPLCGIFDTHSHYDDDKFDGIREELLDGLFELGLEGIITCGCDIPSSERALKLSEKYPKIYAAAGFHPENLPNTAPDLSAIRELLKNKKAVALGEIGLDYHWDIDKSLQKEWFEAQLKLAADLDIPVIVHDREAHSDTLSLLQKYPVKGVVHCFSGSVDTAKEILKLGMYIGIGGVVTFKNARKTVEVAEMLPGDRILLETDCPYLAPEPYRGKLCHSGLIAFTAKRIAEIRGVSETEIRQKSFENADRLFGLSQIQI